MEFTGKNILITGGSSGIGEAIIGELSRHKCNIIVLARNEKKLHLITTELQDNPANIHPFRCDVTNKTDVREVFRTVLQAFPTVDVAILNAGVAYRIPVEEFDIVKAEQTINTNVLGILYCANALFPVFIKQKNGLLVGVSSLADERGFPKSGVYNGSKAAATNILESFRIELKQYNVKVLTVKPGFVKTPMTDKNEFAMPLVWSAEKAARYICNKIQKGKRIIAFPFAIHAAILLLRILPPALFDLLAGGHYKNIKNT